MAASDDRPERGDRVEAVVFRRCEQGSNRDGELRVQALATPSGRVVFCSAGTRTHYADGCPGGSSAPAGRDDGGRFTRRRGRRGHRRGGRRRRVAGR
ncbi:hypothetical protein Acsp04_38630 [Actinomadura sp. NBRC 104425]|uniref:hypothetical protein n=1 Tax=Actinomadura sp. NBRC 104425 TaxID=3032204 RepID=UPI0024A22B81|nr:hypothetical protein [Actinomadura sp. NBRC 104425]GLZ13628.1 hypothetical protein Acsp04_38630 [Actinomadura sp. NBRC 104425]